MEFVNGFEVSIPLNIVQLFQPTIESLALIVLIAVSLIRGKPPERTRFKGFRRKFLRHPAIIFLLIGLLAFVASALLTICNGIPQPYVHDEFSYLLAADTFAHGRLTNPPHLLWKHFETFHVIQNPTYASKYPPGQGLILALGQVLTGYPIVGVWLSVGLACAAICWMLAGWCPLRWAWFGGQVALIGLVFSRSFFAIAPADAYWSQSYWGGAVAALGGALVFGALPRIMKEQRARDAVYLALGLAILANSRPFEGLVASIPVWVILGIWITRVKDISWRTRVLRVILPVVLILLLTALWMGFYNYRVTGNPFLMPYQVCESAYGTVPPFLWQPLKAEPHYHHKIMYDFYRHYIKIYLQELSINGWIEHSIKTIIRFCFFFFGLIFIASMQSLVISRKAWRRRNVIFPLGLCTLLIVALLGETRFFPHYAAPVASIAFLLVVESLRQARRFTWRGRPVGQHFVRGILPTLLVLAIATFAVTHYRNEITAFAVKNYHQLPFEWSQDRARILRQLEQHKGRHLVIVRYSSNHILHDEWVYNRADIDDAKVVWAREMDSQADKELLNYFKDRRVWLLQADKLPRHLTPYLGAHLRNE